MTFSLNKTFVSNVLKNTSCKKARRNSNYQISSWGHIKIESDENMLFEQLEKFCATENEIKKSPTTLSSYLYEREIF